MNMNMPKKVGAVMMAAGAVGFACISEVATAHYEALPAPDPTAILALKGVCLVTFLAGISGLAFGISSSNG
ncbi:hypothetical protein BJG93_34795 (plasmid) [Paraburkholderia sprentiae WSM5005]|uniref:Uncharacterized protein n=1 Tax=Paraburkholderia sprentiae WSM5005 TaxID=754502 RepID=A0ACA8AX59_9BURK|nr:hypothetical protein [Paraburkholderia sprentiae]APA90283.2 hypothetical protein BJG93_34795 [Paraburkholderia sprentiae WSM5005]